MSSPDEIQRATLHMAGHASAVLSGTDGNFTLEFMQPCGSKSFHQRHATPHVFGTKTNLATLVDVNNAAASWVGQGYVNFEPRD